MSTEERLLRAHDLGISAFLGDTIYNFGELVSIPASASCSTSVLRACILHFGVWPIGENAIATWVAIDWASRVFSALRTENTCVHLSVIFEALTVQYLSPHLGQNSEKVELARLFSLDSYEDPRSLSLASFLHICLDLSNLNATPSFEYLLALFTRTRASWQSSPFLISGIRTRPIPARV